MKKYVAKDLKEIRIKAELTMKQASEMTGTTYRTWQSWEDGATKRVPGIVISFLKLYVEAKNMKNFAIDEFLKDYTPKERTRK